MAVVELSKGLCLLLTHLFLTVFVSSASDQDPPIIRSNYKKDFLVLINKGVNITCPFSRAMFYRWSRIEDPKFTLTEEKIFTIKSVTMDNSGLYVCTAINGFGHSEAVMALKVIDPTSPTTEKECAHSVGSLGPCFLHYLSPEQLTVRASENGRLELDCTAVSADNEPLTYSWTFQGPNSPSGMISPVLPNEPRIILKSLTSQMAGEYRCLVTGSKDRLSRTFSLGVNTRSEQLIIGQRVMNITATYGTKVELTCEAIMKEGKQIFIKWGKRIDPQREASYKREGKEVLDWSLNKYLVLPNSQNLPSSDGRRMISRLPVEANDDSAFGQYLCVALDSRGQADHMFVHLSVKKEINAGRLIVGPRQVNITVDYGGKALLTCEVSPGGGKPAVLKFQWGKRIDPQQRSVYQRDSREVLEWSRRTYVVLSGSEKVTSPDGRRVQSRLFVDPAAETDDGQYVCTVVTSTGQEDRKFVYLSVKKGPSSDRSNLTVYIAVPLCIFVVCLGVRCCNGLCLLAGPSSDRSNLTVYIAVPLCIFVVCLGVMVYCLVSRRRQRHDRQGGVNGCGRIVQGGNGATYPGQYPQHHMVSYTPGVPTSKGSGHYKGGPQNFGGEPYPTPAQGIYVASDGTTPSPMYYTTNMNGGGQYPTNGYSGQHYPI